MSRKSKLIYDCDKTLGLVRHGTFSMRKTAIQAMHAIIEDLSYLRLLPTNWYALSTMHLEKLVTYWRKNKNSEKTIINKLSILRRYLKLANVNKELASNKILGINLEKAKKSEGKLLASDVIEKVYHPITKSILEFEMLFGLTKSESILLMVNATINQSVLTIYRDIAYNKKDRRIPIVSKEQENAIQKRLSLIEDNHSLASQYDFSSVSSLYRSELAMLHFNGRLEARKIYAKTRLRQLLTAHSKESAYKILQIELGHQSSSLIGKWFHE